VAPAGDRFYSAGQDGGVCVWDLKTAEKRRHWGRPDEPVHALALSPDGTRLLGACGKVLRLWDAEDGKELAVLPRNDKRVVDGVAFTPDGRRAVSVSPEDHLLQVWDLDGGAEGKAFRLNSAPRGVAVSPDGKRAACGSRGGAYLWRLP
jgi:WD40 repeat protein